MKDIHTQTLFHKDLCPVTGWTVLRKLEWVEVKNRFSGQWSLSGLRGTVPAVREASPAEEVAPYVRDLLQKANQAKSEFQANMSHELRTPLNHIKEFPELVTDRAVGPLNATQKEYLNDVLRSSRHLLSLIDNIGRGAAFHVILPIRPDLDT
jgi:signal transduction histidine kinase